MTISNKSIDRLVQDALAIEAEEAAEAGALGFMARAMVQATLPHKKVEGNEFTRVNGNFTLSILAPSVVGLPYGTIPRLLLSWITTEAVKTHSRDLELGESLSGFMRELDIVPTGGRWGSINRLKDQTTRLFASSITAINTNAHGSAIRNRQIAEDADFWWDPKSPDQAGLWKSTVILTESFYKEITDRPVPIDMRAIKALKKSPMALDIYTWLTYRASYLKQPTLVPWAALAMQFGSNYKHLRDFKVAFVGELRKVVTVYGMAQAEPQDRGLALQPAPTHIGMKGSG